MGLQTSLMGPKMGLQAILMGPKMGLPICLLDPALQKGETSSEMSVLLKCEIKTGGKKEKKREKKREEFYLASATPWRSQRSPIIYIISSLSAAN